MHPPRHAVFWPSGTPAPFSVAACGSLWPTRRPPDPFHPPAAEGARTNPLRHRVQSTQFPPPLRFLSFRRSVRSTLSGASSSFRPSLAFFPSAPFCPSLARPCTRDMSTSPATARHPPHPCPYGDRAGCRPRARLLPTPQLLVLTYGSTNGMIRSHRPSGRPRASHLPHLSQFAAAKLLHGMSNQRRVGEGLSFRGSS